MPYDYDAFISYRRSDAAPIAYWIRNRLQRYSLPEYILAMLSAESQELHKRRPRVYVDRAYEKSSEDFLKRKIFPALDGSQRLIVISTPSVFDSIREADGTERPNWLVREIDYFITKSRSIEPVRAIDLVLGPGGSDQRYPGRLAESVRWDWIDLRAFNRWRSWGLSEALDTGFTKLVAGIYNVPDTALPMLRREERRRRRNLILVSSAIALIVAIILSVLAIGWWSEMRARQIVDFERRLTIATGLIDIGAIPRAVDVLAQLTEESGQDRSPEAIQLLRTWAARLVTAKDQLEKIPKNTMFRWRGRNYLKGDEDIRLSYEGPPVLQGGVSSSGEWLVTFEADRALRVREVSAPTVPLVETSQLDAKPGTISELLQGRLLLFEATGLALHSDEDEADAQLEFGRVFVLLDPQTRIFATVEMNDDDRQFVPACDHIRLTGENVRLFVPNEPERSEPNGMLFISAGGNDPIRWELSASDSSLPAAAETAATVPLTSCPMHVIVAAADDTPAGSRVDLTGC